MILAHEWQLSVASSYGHKGHHLPSACTLAPALPHSPGDRACEGSPAWRNAWGTKCAAGRSDWGEGAAGGTPSRVRTLLPAGHHLSGAEVHFPSCHHTLPLPLLSPKPVRNVGERATPKEHATQSHFAEEVPDLKALFLESPQIYPSLGKQTTSTSHLCRGEEVKSVQKPKSQPQEGGKVHTSPAVSALQGGGRFRPLPLSGFGPET